MAAPVEGGVIAANAADMKLGYNNANIDECLSEAENPGEVLECNTDYDELVSGEAA